MTIPSTRNQAIDYAPCRYNGSRLWFRGPKKTLRAGYVACLGGNEVYGRYLGSPWPVLLESQVECPVVNLGIENAGIDAYINDPGALATAANARVTVIHLTCSHNTSNRFYSVHPRRNDRFLKASKGLRTLYPEMDFTEVHFTRHLLERLADICPDRFEIIAKEVRGAWLSRMRSLINQMNGRTILLWFAPTALADKTGPVKLNDPFLTKSTVHALEPYVSEILEVVPEDWRAGRDDMIVPALERWRADAMPGPAAHREVAGIVAEAAIPQLK